MLSQHGENFIKILDHIKPSKHAYEVFSDWLVLASASLYAWKKDERVEREYTEVAKQYTKEELDKHAELLGLTVNALEEKEQDFLGEVFSMEGLTNSKNGQFFTPYHISKLMAEMGIEKERLPKDRIWKLNDPSCGSGGMLIAMAMALKEYEFDFQHDALFIGQDIDARCARMAFIQLSLLGVPAVIYCMNTLTMQEYWYRETIGYHLVGMEFRLRAEKMIDITKNLEQAEVELEPNKLVLGNPCKKVLQGELF